MYPSKLLHWLKPTAPRLAAGIGIALCALSSLGTAAPTVSQMPLSIGTKVPSNLLLVPSLEFPTMINAANAGSTYNSSNEYTGNFDADKCYQYHYVATETATDVRHFYPTLMASDHNCSNAWSGNWLNWATAQAIEPFRIVLTGGYRVVDTATTTILEKAWADGNDTGGTYFPNRTVNSNVNASTPMGWSSVTSVVRTLGNKMRFTGTATSTLFSATPVAYIPASTSDPVPSGGFSAGTVYEVTVRVKVCVPGLLEPGEYCKAYGSNYKPEGLIQKYEQKLRYSAFGYLNDSTSSPTRRDGGVLRAQQKFVGPQKLDPATNTWVANPAREWDANGVFITNPDSSGAPNSGVINYINKGGQTTGANHKSFDPVSELYYTAVRYLKHQGNVSAYSALPSDATLADIYSDRFPVITDWDDPIQYSCQNNSILGIGDTQTWNDKNLPGNTVTSGEPAMPSEVAADTTVNVMTATAKVAELEGITIGTPFTGRENSAYIAGLAYDSHTRDLRTDVADIQTVSTYWMDVREADVMQAPAQNQFWLAAKYGGFAVPDNYQTYTNTTALAQSLWTGGDLVAGTSYLRPKNFYTASNGASSNTMAQGLAHAFARIAAEERGSSSSLAANSTRLDTETRVYQAQFHSGVWWGDLSSYRVSGNDLASTPEWSAADRLANRSTARNIKTYNPDGNNAARKYPDFTYASLNSAGATTELAALGSSTAEQTMVINYLRGDRSNETSQTDGVLRTRSNILGDIVNSTPTYVGKPNQSLYDSATFTGADTFGDWANTDAIRLRTPMIYVGANDGMLHGFNANTGEEVYAFVPYSVYTNLKAYSDPSYTHKYYVDGDVTVADVYISGWKTILVGTLGRGGKGVFALDVTDPTNIRFLWEKTAADIPSLGNNIGRPVIAQVANGDWRVLIGNGPNSTGGTAKLVMIDIDDGDPHIVNTDTSIDNGLTAVLARDSGSSVDYFSDTAYAGDIKGNLWKFTNLSAASPTVTKLFVAQDPSNAVQPITAAPVVAKNPLDGSIWVLFGTGQYLSESDLSTTQVQSWYGIRDSGTLVARADLVQRQVLSTVDAGQYDARTISQGTATDLVGKGGWYLDLPATGERMVVPNRIQGEVVIGTSRIPSATDICKPGGRGFVMAIDPFTGARLPNSYFDVNGDGVINASDEVGNDPTPASGIGFDSGVNNPIFADGVMLVSKDDGSSEGLAISGKSSASRRLGWRELLN